MNAFDVEPYLRLLPRKLTQGLVLGGLAWALLFPTQFQRWYVQQVEEHAHQLSKRFLTIAERDIEPSIRPQRRAAHRTPAPHEADRGASERNR